MHEIISGSLKSHWEDLLKNGQSLVFKKNQVLFYEGHMPYGVFVLQSGRVHFDQAKNACHDNVNVIPGQAMGVESFCRDEPYCCTCVADEDCKVVFLSKTQLMPYL